MSIQSVDFANPAHASEFVAMLDDYARDPMGNGAPLVDAVRARLANGFQEQPTALAWLAWRGDEPIGVLTAFVGYSTFKARPLINIHDLAIVPSHRGQGIGRRLLETVEAHARGLECCRLTLEVRGDNLRAQRLYRRFGFEGAGKVDPPTGLLFWKKPLD